MIDSTTLSARMPTVSAPVGVLGLANTAGIGFALRPRPA